MPRRQKNALANNSELFLQSINLELDANYPERISHFQPTTKCVGVVRALLGLEDYRSLFLIAPYGSGKSLTAAYAGHLIENNKASKDVRLSINNRLKLVSPDLAEFVSKRRNNATKKGLYLPLHGSVTNVGEQLKDAAIESLRRVGVRKWAKVRNASSKNITEIIKHISELCQEAGCDRITIVWDEFGRHLEALVATGRGDELADIQLLAEICSRTKLLPITFCAILHQGLSHYAAGLPQAIRSNWKKIEGRFETIQYVDDSQEIYRLIAESVASRRPSEVKTKPCQALAKKCLDLGIFTEFRLRDLSSLLQTASPLDPVALYLLPRVAARVAQNERTLFSFLYSHDFEKHVFVSDLYDYFSPSMRADTAVGGTHRQWLETESAISKAADDTASMATLKSACLLGLGTSGERSRTSVELLSLAIEGHAPKKTAVVLNQLIDRKLLLHRVHNDDVSVWHGTDIDLRGRLEEEIAKLDVDFDLVSFLNREAPPPVWKPTSYNDRYCIRRFLLGSYLTKGQFSSLESWATANIARDSDGHILYLVANNEEDLAAAEETAKRFSHDERIVFVIPSEPIPLRNAALEVKALQQMQRDSVLVASDPIALAELQQMTDDARDHLQKLIDRLVVPSDCGGHWYYEGTQIPASSSTVLRQSLSEMMEKVFPKTPVINNEMINRSKPTPALVNARKKLTMAVLERHGRERLGIEGYFPDRSIFNTVLLRTGLYCKDPKSERWHYAHERSIKEPGLRSVWGILRKFLTTPASRPTTFDTLIGELVSPPYGVRLGVIPVLLAAALRAFPSAISIMHKGSYLNDLLPSDLEGICRSPREYQLLVLDVDSSKQKLLRGLHKHLSKVTNYEIEENDLVRHCYDVLEAWKHQLPPAAFTTGRLTEKASNFRLAISRTRDPVQLFFKEIPESLSHPLEETAALLRSIKECIDELENVASSYTEQACEIVRSALMVPGEPYEELGVRRLSQQWASYFPGEFIERLSDGVAKGLLSRMSLEYESDALLIDSIASLLVKKSVRRWDDSMAAAFDREFTAYVTKIENGARSYPAPTKDLQKGLSKLVYGRMQELFVQLIDLVGQETAVQMVEELNKTESKHGVT